MFCNMLVFTHTAQTSTKWDSEGTTGEQQHDIVPACREHMEAAVHGGGACAIFTSIADAIEASIDGDIVRVFRESLLHSVFASAPRS